MHEHYCPSFSSLFEVLGNEAAETSEIEIPRICVDHLVCEHGNAMKRKGECCEGDM